MGRGLRWVSFAPRGGGAIFTLAHISDLHATPVSPRGITPLFGKRALGWLSWQVRRRHDHRPQVLEALVRDLEQVAPDHLVVTGDLTNVSLPGEFEAARGWLARLGPPDRVTAVPGNHDAYVRVSEASSWALWSEYLVSDGSGRELLHELCGVEKDGAIGFPSLRLVRGAALVGLCSALPTPPLWASGKLGRAQLERLEALLVELGARGLARILLIHHPPQPGVVIPRRALRDAADLCAVLRRTGAELVLHGHLHRTRIGSVAGPNRPIPVAGVRSASHAGGRPGRLARYHVYGFAGNPAAPRIVMREREYDPESGAFRPIGDPDGRMLPIAETGPQGGAAAAPR